MQIALKSAVILLAFHIGSNAFQKYVQELVQIMKKG